MEFYGQIIRNTTQNSYHEGKGKVGTPLTFGVVEDEYYLGSWLRTLEDHCVTPQDWLFLH